jgi:16S rRNA (guanine527-N7)-methyltransferase
MATDRGPGPHAAALQRLGLAGTAAASLEAYLDVLAAWAPRVNLTGARTAEERVATLVAPVLPAVPLLGDGLLLDVGSGNGSPGLVLALLRPELPVTLLEPRLKRWAFLREAARAAGRTVRVERARHDQYAGPPAATVTVRALALAPAELAPLAAPGGRLLVFGARPAAAAPWTEEPAPPGAALAVYRRS